LQTPREFILGGTFDGASIKIQKFLSDNAGWQDYIKPDNSFQKELLRLWKKYHLKEVTSDVQTKLKGTIEGLIEEEELRKELGFPIKELLNNPEEYKGLYEQYEDYEDEILLLASWLDLTTNDLEDITEISNCYYCIHGSYYYCGTEEAITEVVSDTIENLLWAFNIEFLSNYGVLEDIKPLRELAEDANEDIKVLIDWEENKEEIVEDAISSDGYGHFLNNYDGTYSEINHNGTSYIICRT